MNFTQTITFRCDDPQAIIDMMVEWDDMQAANDVTGYIGTRVIVDRDDPGRMIIVADFAQVDLDVSAYEEAMRNNDRPDTQEWARRLRDMIDGEPVYGNYDILYMTG